MRVREASHADSWYDGDPEVLSDELDSNLAKVPDTINDTKLPIPGARVIIAPHAGYSYSGPCAAWAYKAWDLSKAKRVFVLGPSHTYYLRGAALTKFDAYATPFGSLTVDTETIQKLRNTGEFDSIPISSDISEHSLEMHLPYIWKRLSQTCGEDSDPSTWPSIVPILIGDNSGEAEKEYAKILAPYLADEENAFVVSSDFCHWGLRFSYTKYLEDPRDMTGLKRLTQSDYKTKTPIHEGIKVLDTLSIAAIETGIHDKFVENLEKTKNTVCGRHPIGVLMAALEGLAKEGKGDGKFKFVQYQRSSLVEHIRDSSVSYAAAYAVV
ncbi:Memo-like protein [Pleurostoma richardsiae]|uniref:Memo-like protein n=1 Tax=Pleurostoma richardsiae TaxID=41990 RepID=A0AA38RL66_9PEZI|nr:Memo-like protein [Pleurostoma richardsiae]